VRLAKVKRRDLAALIESAWRDLAPEKLVAEHDAGRTPPSSRASASPSKKKRRRI